MSNLATHPTDETLAAFALGKLTAPEDTELEEHLTKCEECQRRAAGVAPDSLLGLLMSARSRVGVDQATLCTPNPSEGITPSALAATHGWNSGVTLLDDVEVPESLANHPKYRVVRQLGVGGMGTVWLAEHTVMNRPVAVKVIRPELLAKSGAAGRFLREVRAAAKLHHPNIVTAFDAEQVGDSCLLVMEYVPGETLADRVKGGPLSVTEACRAVRDAARGLAHAHATGLVHRDVKPHNLIRATDGTVKVLDFGLAGVGAGEIIAAAGDGLTGAGMVVGTPDYIAPEQIADPHTADARADIYGLGCTLHHLLAGQPPFPEGSVLQKLTAQETRALTAIPGLPPELASVLAKMTAKRPEDRYQTADEVVAALDSILQPAPTKPRRRWRAIAAGLLFAGFLIAAAVVFKIERDNQLITIETDDPDIEVVMKRKGEVVRVIDKKTGQVWEIDTTTNQIAQADTADGLTLELPEGVSVVMRRKGAKDGKPVFAITRGVKEQSNPPSETENVGEVRRFEGHTSPITRVAMSPNGRLIASAGEDYTVRVWDVRARRQLYLLQTRYPAVPVAFSPDSSMLAAACGKPGWPDPHLIVWDTNTGKELFDLPLSAGWIGELAFSPDNRWLAFAQDVLSSLRIVEARTGKEVQTIKWPPGVFTGWAVAFSPDGSEIASAQLNNGIVDIWDTKTGKPLRQIKGPASQVTRLGYLRDGEEFFTMSLDKVVRVWDLKSNKELRTLPIESRSYGGAISSDGRLVASCHGESIDIWDLNSGVKLTELKGHPGGHASVVFGPDSKHLVSCGNDKTVRLWRVPEPSAPQPFAILKPDAPARQSATLSEAISAARSGDTIEIRGNGPFVTAPLTIQGKALAIRAGAGFRPVFQLNPEGEKANADLLNTDAALIVEGIEFRIGEGNPFKVGPNPAILRSKNASVSAANCRFVMVRQAPYSVVVQPDGSPTVVLRNCEFLLLGHHTAVNWNYPAGGQLVMENCLHVGNVMARVYCPDNRRVSIRLTHNTHATYGSFFEVSLVNPPDFSRLERFIELDVSENAVQGDWLGMCSQNAAITKEQVRAILPRLIWWKDRNNLYCPRLGMLGRWHMGSLGDPAVTDSKTLADWEKFWGLADTKSQFAEALRFTGEKKAADLRAKLAGGSVHLTPADFRLAKGSPGQGAGNDGNDLGADVDLVGPGAAYERWRKTTDYSEWQRSREASLREYGEVWKFEGHTQLIRSVAISADGSRVVSGSHDGTVRLWDAGTGKEVLKLDAKASWCTAVAFTPTATHALAGYADGSIRLWDLKEGNVVRKFEGHEGHIGDVAISPDGSRVFSVGGHDKTVRIWNFETAKQLHCMREHKETLTHVAVSRDGKRILTGGFLEDFSAETTQRLWDAVEGKQVAEFKGPSNCGFTFLNGNRVLTVNRTAAEDFMQLWDLVSNKRVAETRPTGVGFMNMTGFPDGRHVLTCGMDQMLRIWEAETFREVHVFHAHGGTVRSVALSASGRLVAFAGGDDDPKKPGDFSVRLWRLPERYQEPGWMQLFNGKTVDGWGVFPKDTWKVENGALVCNATKWSDIFTAKQYGDVHIRLELKLGANSHGALRIRASALGAAGITLGRALPGEPRAQSGSLYQDLNGKTDVLAIYPEELIKLDTWCVVEAIVRGNEIVVRIDGTETTRTRLNGLAAAGSIVVSAVSGTMHVRKFDIKELPATVTPPAKKP